MTGPITETNIQFLLEIISARERTITELSSTRGLQPAIRAMGMRDTIRAFLNSLPKAEAMDNPLIQAMSDAVDNWEKGK
jgi:hypothetical protein